MGGLLETVLEGQKALLDQGAGPNLSKLFVVSRVVERAGAFKAVVGGFFVLVCTFCYGYGLIVVSYDGTDANCQATPSLVDVNVPDFMLLSIAVSWVFLSVFVCMLYIKGLLRLLLSWLSPLYVFCHWSFIIVWIVGFGSAILAGDQQCKNSEGSLMWYHALVFIILQSLLAIIYTPIFIGMIAYRVVKYSNPAAFLPALSMGIVDIEDTFVAAAQELAAVVGQADIAFVSFMAQVLISGSPNIYRSTVASFCCVLFLFSQAGGLVVVFRQRSLDICDETLSNFNYTLEDVILIGVAGNTMAGCAMLFAIVVWGYRWFNRTWAADVFVMLHFAFIATWVMGFGGALLANSPECKAQRDSSDEDEKTQLWNYVFLFLVLHGLILAMYFIVLLMRIMARCRPPKEGADMLPSGPLSRDNVPGTTTIDEDDLNAIINAANGQLPPADAPLSVSQLQRQDILPDYQYVRDKTGTIVRQTVSQANSALQQARQYTTDTLHRVQPMLQTGSKYVKGSAVNKALNQGLNQGLNVLEQKQGKATAGVARQLLKDLDYLQDNKLAQRGLVHVALREI